MNNNYDGSVIINTVLDLTGVKKGVNQVNTLLRKSTGGVMDLEREFKNLGATAKKVGALIGGAFAVSKLVSFAKECVELGSNLAEVQNVVDSVFTSMSDSVNDFAKEAASSFGLSETMAKQYVGTYGAMAKAFGFTEQKAYEMSTTLTGLAGDVASFYNLDQDAAYTKLKAVFSGETESLKDLGIVMTQTALDSYALQEGIGKTTSKMTEQEKVALRYRFIMDQLSTASGDFARTSDSWANQTRILRLQVDSLKASLGAGLINLFTPALKAINMILSKLATLANAFKAFTELITGKKATEGSSGGGTVANTYNAAADGANALADATDRSTNATKKANKVQKEYLSGLDEIHKYTKEEADSSTGASPSSALGGLADISGAGVDYGKMSEGKTVVDNLADSFSKLADLLKKKDWEGLGEYMANGINKGLKKVYDFIKWDNVGPKITEFVNAFTRTFNSLVDKIDWDLAGRTIGAGINTIVNTIRTGINGIDWFNLGAKLSAGVMGLVKEVNWMNLGNLLGEKIMLAWDIFGGWVSGLDFELIGTSVGDALNGAFKKIDLKKIGTYLKRAINGAFTILKTFTRTFDWEWALKNVTDGLNEIFRGIDWEDAGQTLEEFWKELDTFLLGISTDVDWEAVGEGIGDFLSKIHWEEHLVNLVKVLKNILVGIWEGLGKTSAGKFIQAMAFVLVGGKLLGLANTISTILTGKSVTSVLTTGLSKMIGTSITDAGKSSTVKTALTSLKDTLVNFFKGSGMSAVVSSASTALGLSGIVLGVGEVTKVIERLQGGNGILSEFGTACHQLTQELLEIGRISGPEFDAISSSIEQWESEGKEGAEMADLLVQKLAESGVSAEDAKEIMRKYGWQISMTENATKTLTEKVDQLGEGFSRNTEKLDFSVYDDGNVTLQKMATVLATADAEGNDLNGTINTLIAVLGSDLNKPVMDAEGAFNHLLEVTEGNEEAQAALITLFSGAFPEAAAAAQAAASQTADEFDDISTSADNSSQKITGVSRIMGGFLEEVNGKSKEAKDAIVTAVGEIGTALQNSGTSVKTGMGESSTVVDEKAAAIAASVISNWGASEKSVRTNLDSMRSAIAQKMFAMQQMIKTYCESFAGLFTYNFGEMGAKGVMDDFFQYVTTSLQNLSKSLPDLFSQMASSITGPINTFIGKLNALINGAQNAQHAIADILSFDITLPEAIARQVGWSRAWLRVPQRSTFYRVPYLASGAVIPPNAPFTAVLGDQKRGNNIETPENLMRQIFREELGNMKGGSYHFTAELNRRTLFDQVIEEAKLRQDQSGYNPFDLA